MQPKNLRECGGSLELQGGTGTVLHMIGLESFLEAYKSDTTFRIQTPEGIDPKNTNPNAPFVVTRIDGVGSSNLAVARILLQGNEILKQGVFVSQFDKVATLNQLYACKEQLVICEQIAERIGGKTEEIVELIQKQEIGRDKTGRAINPLPQVKDLFVDTAAFLIHSKRTLSEITALISITMGLEVQGSSFTELGRKLEASLGSTDSLTRYVREQEETVTYLVDLRNFQEHPKKRQTIIKDFHVLSDGTISPPLIYLSDEEPQILHEQLRAASGYLMRLTEAVFINVVLARLVNNFPFYIEEIEADAIKAECPIKYRLSIDFSRLQQASG
jgi:hypothetical protein